MGECPVCDRPVRARCGKINIWHWAHIGKLECDPWWENETAWHRTWKEKFPPAWQEVALRADNGDRHRADVRTDGGWTIEFQYSHIDPDERRSRDEFYKRIAWVVNGSRRKRDAPQFAKAWNAAPPVKGVQHVRRLFLDECALLREWASSPSPIFIDFGDGKVIWWLFHKNASLAYVMPFTHSDFVSIHHGQAPHLASSFEALVSELSGLVRQLESSGSQAPQPLLYPQRFPPRRRSFRL